MRETLLNANAGISPKIGPGVYAQLHELVLEAKLTSLSIWAHVVPWLHSRHLPGAIVLVALLTTAFVFHRRYRQWRSAWLSNLIEDQIREMRSAQTARLRSQKSKRVTAHLQLAAISDLAFRTYDAAWEYFRYRALPALKTAYFPSVTSVAAIIALLSIIMLLPNPPDHLSSDFHPTLVWRVLRAKMTDQDTVPRILEGLIGVVVALIIFVAESIRSSANSDQKRVLLKISNLWPLSILVTLSPLIFLYGPSSGLLAALAATIAFIAIWSFARVLLYLLDPSATVLEEQRLLSDRIRRIVLDSVRERVGNRILYDKLGTDREISIGFIVSSTLLPRTSDFEFIDAPASGTLIDINLNEIEALARLLEQKAATQAPSDLHRATGALATTSAQNVAPNRGTRRVERAYLIRQYRERVAEGADFTDNRTLLAVQRSIADSKIVLDLVRDQVARAFRFSEAEPASVAFRREMQSTKDRLLQAIREFALSKIDDLKETYLLVAEEFLRVLNELGGGYTAAQARQERSSLFSEWSEVRWLVTDTREILLAASETDRDSVIEHIVGLPYTIAVRSLQAGDQLLFQEFLGFGSYLYHLGARKPAISSIRKFLVERSWAFIREISEYYVEPYLTDPSHGPSNPMGLGKRTLENCRDAAIYAFRVFQDLLKTAADNRDYPSVKAGVAVLSTLFRRFIEQPTEQPVELLEAYLAHATDPKAIESIRAQIDTARELKAVAERLHLAKNQVIFGVGYWALGRFLQDPEEKDSRKITEELLTHLPNNLTELTDIFGSVIGGDPANFWGWDWWGLPSDGRARYIDTHTGPNRLYAVKALRVLAMAPPGATANVHLPTSHELAFAADPANQQGLLAMLSADLGRPEWLSKILGQRELDAIPVLITLLSRMRADQESNEENELIVGQPDAAKIDQFRRDVVAGARRFGRIRGLFTKLNLIERSEWPAEKDGVGLGFNQIDDKGAFLTHVHTSYVGWGETYGRGLGQAEDERAFASMVEASIHREAIQRGKLIAEITSLLETQNLRDPVVLQSLDSLVEHEELRSNESFIPRHKETCPETAISGIDGYIGVLTTDGRNIPVFDVFVPRGELSNIIFVADLRRFAKWRQYTPSMQQDEQGEICDDIYFHIRDLNVAHDVREQIIAEDPDWLREKEDKERYLRGRVLVKILEGYEIQVLDSGAAFSFPMASP